MKEQKFKFVHHTAIYHGGGKYTLIADEGYLMQSGTTQAKQVEVKDTHPVEGCLGTRR